MPSPRGIRKAGQDIFTVNFADYLPGALKQDPKIKAIAEAVTKEALTVSGEIENVLIYSRIDELPEALIDILAYDMHVDWYDYSFPLKVKRDILKSSVKVHKKMGTKYAVEKALGALYPQSEVEEWYQYEGKPHHFHIVCDVTENRVTASFQEIINAVMMYKRLSSHLDEVVYQASVGIRVETHTDFFLYKNPATGSLLAGTYPQRIRRGVQAGSVIVVGTDAAGFIFLPTQAGTYPYRNTIFRHTGAQIDVETASNAFRHTNTPAGRIRAGEEPQRSYRGAQAGTGIEAQTGKESFAFSSPAAGTAPDRNTIFRHTDAQIDAETALKAYGYRNTPAGQINAGEEPQRSHRGAETGAGIETRTEAEGTPFSVPAAGTAPDRNTVFQGSGANIEAEGEAEGFPFFMQAAGTKPERNVVMSNSEAGIAAEEAADGFLYTVKAAGTVPERNTGEGAGSGGIESTVKAEVFKHTNKPCGSRRKL
ncbi:phage tail protein I [Clostridiaceae bacterium]|nr:phage tail protein I [Clostridiaceae bacterium]